MPDVDAWLYRLVQFAIREAVASRTLDEVLSAKNALDAELRAFVRERIAETGIEVTELGVKDVILPGEIRELVNKVVEAERTAKANLIRRQEETAATRSLLNTAKLMEDNPLLLRLKELELIERLVEKVGRIDLHAGEGAGLDALLTKLVRLKADEPAERRVIGTKRRAAEIRGPSHCGWIVGFGGIRNPYRPCRPFRRRRPASAACRPALLRHFGDHGLGGDQEAGHGGRALQGLTHDLGRVDDALLDHVDVFAVLGVEAEAVVLLLDDLADDHRTVLAGVGRDLAGRSLDRLAHDLDAGPLVVVVRADLLEHFGRAQQRHAAARQDAFFDRRAGGVHRVVDAILALLHLDLGRAADADHRDAARELGETLLQLLTVVVRGGLLDLRLDLRDAVLDVLLLAGAVDDRGVLLVDHHLLGAAEHGDA